MSQGGPGIELDTSLGYMLKAAASALHSAMEAVLRPLGMTITHYACLELLDQRPGLSNSELARGAFVTRQSMNVLLRALERQGLVVPPGTGTRRQGPADRADRPRSAASSRWPAPRFAASSKTCWPIWMPAGTRSRCGACSPRASPH